MAGPVGGGQGNLQCPAQFSQAVAVLTGQQNGRQFIGVEDGRGQFQAGRAQKREVEPGAVGDDGLCAVAEEVDDFR